MDAFGTISVNGATLSEQNLLIGWNSSLALDSYVGITEIPNPINSQGAFTPELELLLTSTPQFESSSVGSINSSSFSITSNFANVDSLTGVAADNPLVGISKSGEYTALVSLANFHNSNVLDGHISDGITSPLVKATLDLAITNTKEQLGSFVGKEKFLEKMNLPFGNDWQPQAANTLIENLVSGEAMPKIEILPAANLNANGAFGEDTIYLSEEFLTRNVANPEVVAGVLSEEIGHYIDQELNSVDSPGDEGNIFARLVQGETIAGAELAALKAEDDSANITLNGQAIALELSDYPGYLLQYQSGQALTYDQNVEDWQQRMKDRGWDIDVDGLYGPQSKSVALQFQQAKDLAIDGIVGPETWGATFDISTPSFPGNLFKYESGTTLIYDENVRQWQQRMSDLGKTIDVDGLYGPQSAQVARDFQAEQGLSVDGIVGPQTWEASFDTDPVTPPVDPVTPPVEPVTPPVEPVPPGPTSFREQVVAIARQEWDFFGNNVLEQTGEDYLEETEDNAWQHIAGEYWQTQGINRTDIDTPEEVGDDDNPWSAAFISWVMQEAGAGEEFNYSQLHANYINQAITERESDASFIAYDIDEYSPQVGDLIGANRSDAIVTYDTAVETGGYPSHVDIVVATRPGEIDVIGGNVEQSVTLKTLQVDSEGKIINPDDGDASDDFFVVIENRFGGDTPPPAPEPPAPPPTGSTPYDATEIVNSAAVDPEIREYAEESVPIILNKAQESGITDPGQIAYILASADHESLLGKYMEEIASGEDYEGREDLGNTEPGDGPRFKGRGYVQITGRNNYTSWSEKLGVDLVNNPELAAIDSNIAATILVEGMRDGSFTGVGLSDYINGDSQDFVNARRIVNGDVEENGSEIAQDAEIYYEVLTT